MSLLVSFAFAATVGVEQTADSVLLPQAQFPAKTVLLLGDEAKGIPSDLLTVCCGTVVKCSLHTASKVSQADTDTDTDTPTSTHTHRHRHTHTHTPPLSC